MGIGRGFELASDAQFREMSNFSTPPRAGKITAIEGSGQVRVDCDDPEGGDVLAWPLNGFTYAVDDVVYVAFAVNHPESAIVIGSKGSTPELAGVGATIHGASAKTTPVDADTMPLIDSAASNVLKKVSWSNIKATLKTYFDTLYVALTGDQTIAGIKTFSNGITKFDSGASGFPFLQWLQNATSKAIIGISNGADVLVAGSVSGDLAFRAASGKMLFSTDDGTTAHMILEDGQLTIDQASTTAAIPVLKLDQADESEPFIALVGTAGSGKSFNSDALGSYVGKIKITGNGSTYYIPFYN